MRSVLVIAGSDSGGGAGIQADLKALTAVGVHGCTAITCVTAQNTQGVTATYPLPPEAIREQIRAVREDIAIHGVKTGMLYSAEIVRAAAEELRDLDVPLVVDPVMVATAGSRLSTSDFAQALTDRLLPRTTLLTPNLDEVRALTGRTVEDVTGMREAARALQERGPEAVLVKGGHLEGELVDILYDGTEFHAFRGFRYPQALHGSGCAYASSVAGFLAQGRDLVESVRQARRRIAAGFASSYAVGKGVPLIHAGYVEDRWSVWQAVRRAVEDLLAVLPPGRVPEVGTNLAYAVPGAQTEEDVCAVTGRLVRAGDRVVAVGPPAFGASRHVARIVLAAMDFDPRVRAAVNLRYGEDLVAACQAVGFRLGTFDRAEEPPAGSTMDWGTRAAIRQAGAVPDAIYDRGGPGKVPMLRILGRDPSQVVDKVAKVVGG